jgi:hypothetical protein
MEGKGSGGTAPHILSLGSGQQAPSDLLGSKPMHKSETASLVV